MSKPRGKSTSKSRDRGGKDKGDDDSHRKSASLAFTVLLKEDSEELLGQSAIEMESKLKEVFHLSPATDLKDAAILDYYVGATYWAKQQGFDAEQLSGFFSVAHSLLHKFKEENTSVVDLLKEFRTLLVGIGTDIGPDLKRGGLEFFNIQQAKNVTDYLKSSLLQHFKLYKFLFQNSQWEEIIGNTVSVEVPIPADTPFPPPLDEGISETTFKEFLMIPTPTASEHAGESRDKESEKAMTPIEVDLPDKITDLFAKLTPDDVRSIIQDVSQECLHNLQIGVESKIRTQENAVLAKINKIHNVLPDPKEVTEEVPK